MRGSQLQSEYAVSKIVPVYDDLATSQSSDYPDESEGGDTRGILGIRVSVALSCVHDRLYLDEYELWWVVYCKQESAKNGRHLMQYLYWRREDKGDLAEEGWRFGQVTKLDVG